MSFSAWTDAGSTVFAAGGAPAGAGAWAWAPGAARHMASSPRKRNLLMHCHLLGLEWINSGRSGSVRGGTSNELLAGRRQRVTAPSNGCLQAILVSSRFGGKWPV